MLGRKIRGLEGKSRNENSLGNYGQKPPERILLVMNRGIEGCEQDRRS